MSHFYAYDESGAVQPKHFVPMAKDPSRTRPSRVTDAKKAAKSGERWYASVTTILGVLDKPGLNNWRVDQHIQTVFEAMNLAPMDDLGVFTSWVKSETQERLDQAPKAGTDIHQLLEDYFSGKEVQATDIEKKICKNVLDALREVGVDPFACEKEKYFINTEEGYAGCADLVGNNWVIDYKSKQEAAKFKPGKMAYDEHRMQLAAYGNALFTGDFNAANIFICLENGEVDLHIHKQAELDKAGWMFHHSNEIYKLQKYDANGE